MTRGTVARRALAWHHNSQDVVLGASCGIEVSEIVLTEWRNPEEIEDVMASDSSKDVSNLGVSMESVGWNPSPDQSQ